MLKGIVNDITLSVQARNGLSPAVIVWMSVIAVAALAAVIFLCVAGYAWLSLRVDAVTAGLIMAGIFAVVALIAALITALIRRRVRERAILARAAKAHSPSWLLDPRFLGVAVEAGRSIGWERILPVAVLGFVVAQWARDSRTHDKRQT
ncbi:MAG TPA: hypothetical protein VMA30_17400 [Xanthobacteraceae bacterium]|nr:hypothetical protein [Xanthobacteraceae bacterium]